MKLSKKYIAIGALVILVVVVFVGNKPIKKPNPYPDSAVNTTQQNTSSDKPNVDSMAKSKYSAVVKAKVRQDFINTCYTQAHYDIPTCTCGADYLASNYTEDQLTKMYVDFHATQKAPAELELAVKACTKK